MSEFKNNQQEVSPEKAIRDLFHEHLKPIISPLIKHLINAHQLDNSQSEPFIIDLHGPKGFFTGDSLDQVIQAVQNGVPLKDTVLQTQFNTQFNPYYFMIHPDEAQSTQYVSRTERVTMSGNRAYLALPFSYADSECSRVDFREKLDIDNRLASVLIDPEFNNAHTGGVKLESVLNDDGLEIEFYYIIFEKNNSKYLPAVPAIDLMQDKRPQELGGFSPIVMMSSYFKLIVPRVDVDLQISNPYHQLDNYFLDAFDWTELGLALAKTGSKLSDDEIKSLFIREANRFIETLAQNLPEYIS